MGNEDENEGGGPAAAVAAGAAGAGQAGDKSGNVSGMYDPSKRDPQYAHAERSCMWEVQALSQHAHPSVSAMAKSMLAGVPVQYKGDPLKDFVLAEFLGKFIAKKTKPKKVQGGDSYMQPTGADKAPNMLAAYEKKSVAPDEAFFHKFFEIRDSRAAKTLLKAKKRRAEEADVSDDDSSLAEDDFLAGEEGDDATYGDVDDVYDYDQLAAAMQEDEMDREELSDDLSGDDSDDSDDSDEGSLEGAEFPDDMSLPGDDGGSDSDGDSDSDSGGDLSDDLDDLLESDMEDGGKGGKGDDDVFASLDDWQAKIDEDFDG